jgi:hypothetical protein
VILFTKLLDALFPSRRQNRLLEEWQERKALRDERKRAQDAWEHAYHSPIEWRELKQGESHDGSHLHPAGPAG